MAKSQPTYDSSTTTFSALFNTPSPPLSLSATFPLLHTSPRVPRSSFSTHKGAATDNFLPYTLEDMKDSYLNLRFLEIFLRLSLLPLTITSAFMVVQAKDASDLYGKVDFTNISGFKFLLSMNCISAPYALISVSLLMGLGENKTAWSCLVLDQLLAYLMVSSSSAAAEVLYLAHEGDIEVSWSEVCSYFGRFCSRAKVSLVLQFVALLCFICLSMISAFRVFSRFEAPSTSSKEEGRQGSDGY